MSEDIKNIIAEVELTLDITIKPMALFQRQHIKQLLDLITNLQNQLQQKDNIIKEVRETLDNKRTIMTTQLLNGVYCNYEELLYQVDEEIRKILDKVGENK